MEGERIWKEFTGGKMENPLAVEVAGELGERLCRCEWISWNLGWCVLPAWAPSRRTAAILESRQVYGFRGFSAGLAGAQ